MARKPLPPITSATPNESAPAATDATGAKAPIECGQPPEDPDRGGAERDADEEAEADLLGRSRSERSSIPYESGRSIQAISPSVSAMPVGSLPPDSASSVRASVRRMCVWRSVAKTAAASVARDDGAEQDRLEPGEVEEPVRGDAGEERADDDADRAEEGGRHGHLAQAPPRGLQSALVEDQREPDDPDLACELRVVELDPAGPVRAEQHPEREERRRAPVARSAPLRVRRRCSPRESAPTSRSTRPSSTPLSSPVGVAAAAWNTSGMATRPRTRKIGRLSEIAQVAVRHGFGYFFERHKLTDILPWTSRDELDPAAPAIGSERGRHLREMLDELGPTFVKFGQLLSTRPDVVPPDIVVELRGLQDDVRPFPFAQIRQVIEAELGLTLEQAFAPLRRAADRRRVDRPGAPRDASERRRGGRQGAAPERPAPDRVRSGAALPGREDDQGARPRARLHRRARARRRVRPLDPAGARLQARGAPRRELPPQLRRLGARGRAEGLLGLLQRPDADARVPRRHPARRPRPGDDLPRGAARARLPGHADVDGDDLRARLLPRRPAPGERARARRRPDRPRRLRAGRQADRRGHGAPDAALHRRRDRERRRAAAPARPSSASAIRRSARRSSRPRCAISSTATTAPASARSTRSR